MAAIRWTLPTSPVRRWLRALSPWRGRSVERLADAVGAASADDATAYQVPLARGAVRRFTRPPGMCLSCVRGAVWITVDGDPVDHVMAAGESFLPGGARHVIVYGLDDAVLRVQPSGAARAGAAPRLVVQADPA